MTRLDQPLPATVYVWGQASRLSSSPRQSTWLERDWLSNHELCFFPTCIFERCKSANLANIVSCKNMFRWCLVRSNLILKKERADPNWLLIVKFTALRNPRALCNNIRVASFILPKKIIWKKTLNYLQTTVASGKSHPLWQSGWPPR